ncbi:TraI domain-containing protein [Rodentibacter heidelbergensis]
MYNEPYKKPIKRYAEMVQLLPSSESHHHSHLGEILDHGL